MRKSRLAVLFGVGIAIMVLGLFLFGITFSIYQSCTTKDTIASCNSQIPLGQSLEVIGGALTATGLGLIAAVLFLPEAWQRTGS